MTSDTNTCIESENPAITPETDERGKFAQVIDIFKSNGYKYTGKLGKGRYGDVMSMKSPDTEDSVAMKIVKKNLSKGEFKYWPHLHHPNVLPLKKIYFTQEPFLCVFSMDVQESFDSIIYDENFRSHPSALWQIQKWLREILEGLNYLHNSNLTHQDLKPDNILISKEGSAVLMDYSLLTSTERPVTSMGVFYLHGPPEACPSHGESVPVDGVAVDMWCYGLVALEAITGDVLSDRMPAKPRNWINDAYPCLYKILQEIKLKKFIKAGLPEVELSEEMIWYISNFIYTFLHVDPRLRPSAEQALRHEFLFFGSGIYFLQDIVWKERAHPYDMESLLVNYLKDVKIQYDSFVPRPDESVTPFTILSLNDPEERLLKVDWNKKHFQVLEGSATVDVENNSVQIDATNQGSSLDDDTNKLDQVGETNKNTSSEGNNLSLNEVNSNIEEENAEQKTGFLDHDISSAQSPDPCSLLQAKCDDIPNDDSFSVNDANVGNESEKVGENECISDCRQSNAYHPVNSNSLDLMNLDENMELSKDLTHEQEDVSNGIHSNFTRFENVVIDDIDTGTLEGVKQKTKRLGRLLVWIQRKKRGFLRLFRC